MTLKIFNKIYEIGPENQRSSAVGTEWDKSVPFMSNISFFEKPMILIALIYLRYHSNLQNLKKALSMNPENQGWLTLA